MKLQGKKIGILIENKFEEPEIWYYKYRFPEEGADVHFLTRLWGQPELEFKGDLFQDTLICKESFEYMDDEELRSYAVIIVPGGMVSDKLRWTEDVNKLPPATNSLKRVFAEKSILKGIICHGMLLVTPAPELVQGRRVVVNNNLIGDVRNMNAIYVNEDVVADGDLVTTRSSGHCYVFVRKIIDLLDQKNSKV